MKPKSPNALKSRARRIALQALYGWSLSDNSLTDIESYIFQQHADDLFDKEYFQILLKNVITDRTALEQLLSPYLSRHLDEMDDIELNVLRIAAFELRDRLEIPYRVVINEALNLTKMFGATDGYKFVNGVLDKMAHDLRPSEFE